MTEQSNAVFPRARAVFQWGAVSGAPAEFVATLFEGLEWTVGLRCDALPGLIVGALLWDQQQAQIKPSDIYWDPKLSWNQTTRETLLLKATNALRRQLALGPHPATGRYPGAE